MKLLVYNRGDPAGVNIAAHLQEKLPFTQSEFNGKPALAHSELVLQGIDSRLISMDIPLPDVEWVLCLSCHASASGKPCLTTHTPGNLTAHADVGGKPSEVGISNPQLQTLLLRELFRSAEDRGLGCQVTVEATHHGPTSFQCPITFVEIGSDEAAWSDPTLGEAVASTVHRVLSKPLPKGPGSLAVGGGHYSEKFTKMMIEGNYAIGHIVPKYAMADGMDPNMFKTCMERTFGGCSSTIVDWKGATSKFKEALSGICQSLGTELIRA